MAFVTALAHVSMASSLVIGSLFGLRVSRARGCTELVEDHMKTINGFALDAKLRLRLSDSPIRFHNTGISLAALHAEWLERHSYPASQEESERPASAARRHDK